MFEQNPHYKLFNKACKYWDNACKWKSGETWGSITDKRMREIYESKDYDKAFEEFDKLLILIREQGDILKPKPVRDGDLGWTGTVFDNLHKKYIFLNIQYCKKGDYSRRQCLKWIKQFRQIQKIQISG